MKTGEKNSFRKKLTTPLLFLLISVCALIYFYQPVLKGNNPIPTDAMVGLYHPFRDLYSDTNPNGVPFKNMLITDPVRQIIPWKDLALDTLKQGSLPTWNPYEMTGKPLLANFQSSPLYPFNFLMMQSFQSGWTIFIILQQILAFIFMYLYLKNKSFEKSISICGAFIFSFSGFIIAWLEWGTVVHTYLWLPAMLFCIDKIIVSQKHALKFTVLYTATIICALLAGHLQTFLYIYALSLAYVVMQLLTSHKEKRSKKILLLFLANAAALFITSVQWLPTLQFILLSARNTDQLYTSAGWFIPPIHLLQYLAPDFFGNPATGNYFGTWNYAEFLGYIGLLPLILALITIGRRKKEIILFQITVVLCLIFALDTPLTRSLYALNIPFFSTTQPTRLLSIVGFSLVVLATYGLEELFAKKSMKRVVGVLAVFIILFATMYILLPQNILGLQIENIAVAKRNLILPALILGAGTIILVSISIKMKPWITTALYFALFLLIIFDLTRTGAKFTPFSESKYFYPQTETIEFLQNQGGQFRIATTDSRILAPNIPTYYHLETIEGYDPLYLNSYAQFIALNERGNADISPPYGFNRIITPRRLDTKYIDFLNVKYILSLSEEKNPNWNKVFQEGETRVYENTSFLPRAFLVTSVLSEKDDSQVAERLQEVDLTTTAVTKQRNVEGDYATGSASIKSYTPSKVVITTSSKEEAFLVLSDAYYPTWKVQINGVESSILQTNLAFRGVILPAGENEVVFYTSLF